MLLVVLSIAFASPRSSREPLPNREVERPIVLPRGWTEAHLEMDAQRLQARIRYGVSPRAELWWRLGIGRAEGNLGIPDPGFGARWLLTAGEAPAGSLAAEAAVLLPGRIFGGESAPGFGELGPGYRAGLAGRKQVGGLLFSGRLQCALHWSSTSGAQLDPGGEGEILLQGGPLAVGGGGKGTLREGGLASVRLLVQPTRGVDLEGAWWWSVTPNATDVGPRARVAVRW